jgi:hypothetical protein
MNFHATVNGKAALFNAEDGELARLPDNILRIIEKDGVGPCFAVDKLGRDIQLDWWPPLAHERVVVFYEVEEYRGSRRGYLIPSKIN